MSNEAESGTLTPSVAAPESVNVEKAGNVSTAQVAQELLKRSQPKPSEPSAEHVTPAPVAEAPGAHPAPAGDEPAASPEVTAAKPETAAPETDDVLSTESNPLDPKIQAKIDRKIAKEVAKREALRIENEVLKDQLRNAAKPQTQTEPTKPIIPTVDQPLAHVQDVQALVAEQQSAKEVKRWAETQLDREDIAEGVKLGDRTYSKSDLKAMVRNASVILEDHIPQRNAFLQERQRSAQQAVEAFPWMKDTASMEYQAAQQAYKQYPWLANVADAPMVIGKQIMGALAFQKLQTERQAPAAAKPAKPTPPASQTVTGAQPGAVRVPQSTQAQQKLQAQVDKAKQQGNVSRSDVARILQQRELVNHNR